MLELINNLALLLSLGIVYEASTYASKKMDRYKPYLNGFLIGLIGCLIMSMPLQYARGLAFDTRSVLISVSGLIFGAVPTLIAALVTAAYRIIQGGAGWLTGVTVIFASAVTGLLWRRLFFSIDAKRRWVNLLCFGIIVHLIVLGCMFLLPWPLPIDILESVGLPILSVYSVGTVLLSLLLIHQKERHDALLDVWDAEERYRSLFNNSHIVMLLIDPQDGQLLDANQAAIDFYGWTADILKQKRLKDICLMPPDELDRQLLSAMTGQQRYYTTTHIKSSGAETEVEIFNGPVKIKSDVFLYLIVHDISARIASEKAMQESESRFRKLVEYAPDAIFIQTKMAFAYVNQRAVKLYGADCADDLIGTLVMNRIHPDYRDVVLQRIKTINETQQVPPPLEEVYLKLDGTAVSVEVTAVPMRYQGENGAVVFSRDISSRKQQEIHLRQQQKLEAIGILAGGVAHEINNPVNGIMNYAELILDDVPEAAQASAYAREIIHESERISQIVKNLLQFSRYEKQTFSLADISDIINHSLTLIRALMRKDQIDLRIQIDEHLPRFRCRSQQIQQVMINLLTNARDALNEKYPGPHHNKILRLACRSYENGAGRFLRIEVEDHGSGIPIDIRERIYEPFFSTKAKEKGTGLGLAISFGIILDHRGTIKVESEEGEFTRFIIDLPTDPFSQGVNDE